MAVTTFFPETSMVVKIATYYVASWFIRMETLFLTPSHRLCFGLADVKHKVHVEASIIAHCLPG